LNDFLLVNPRFDAMKSFSYFEDYTNFNSVTIIDEDLMLKKQKLFVRFLMTSQQLHVLAYRLLKVKVWY